MTKNEKYFINLFQKFAVFFTIVILALSAAGLILTQVNSKELDIKKYFDYENPGLPFSYILIMAGIIFIITLIFIFISSPGKTNKTETKGKSKYDKLFKSHHIYQKKKMV